MTTLYNTELFYKWLEKHNKNVVEDKSLLNELDSWLQKQVSVPKPNLSAINWGDFKQEMIKPQQMLGTGTGAGAFGSTGFTLPPLRRDKLNERNFKLIPRKTQVKRPGKMPYFATRWVKIKMDEKDKDFIIIPIEDFEGDIHSLFETWQNFIESEGKKEEKFIVPLVGLQEMMYKDLDGILLQYDNKIIGVVSIDVDENDEADISIISAGPMEIEAGVEEDVEEILLAGIKQYMKHRDYHNDSGLLEDEDGGEEEDDIEIPVSEEKEDEEDNEDEDEKDIKKQVAPVTGGRRRKQSEPRTIFRMMVVRGLYPKTGKPENPGAWIRKDKFEKEMESQGIDPTAMTQQLDNYREQNRNQYFFEFGDEYYNERVKSKQQMAALKRNKSGQFQRREEDDYHDEFGVSKEEYDEYLKDAALQEVMKIHPPSLDDISVPLEGSVVPIEGPQEDKRGKKDAKRADDMVSLSAFTTKGGVNVSELNQRALEDWFDNEYLQGRSTHSAAHYPKSHWENVLLAPDPNDPDIDVIALAKDPTAQAGRNNRYIYTTEYEQRKSEAKFSRMHAYMSYSDLILARMYHDLSRSDLPKTQRVEAQEVNERENNVALGLLVQHELLLRSGNRQNIGGKAFSDEEAKGVKQLQKNNIRFEGDNAFLTFLGKDNVPHFNLPISNPILVDALKNRYAQIPDNAQGEDSLLFSYHSTYDVEYMNKITNGWFTPHDLRTLHANRIALEMIDEDRVGQSMPKTSEQFFEKAGKVVDYLAGLLRHGNRKTTTRSYLSSSVILELAEEVEDLGDFTKQYNNYVREGLMPTMTKHDRQYLEFLHRQRQQQPQSKKNSRRSRKV